jgi:exopolysaccharide production protein ExoQ
MPPQIAFVLCLIFVAFLLWRHGGWNQDVSRAVWIPIVWMFLVGTRYLSQWLGQNASSSTIAQMDGSPIDRAAFAILIVAGLVVLWRRGSSTLLLLRRNKIVCLFFLFALFSTLWSDYPLIAFKRWFKASGNVVMAMLLLTEKDPKASVGVLLRHIAILALPMSVVYIKYFPELGRADHHGLQLYNGVALHKNTLGQLCLLSGIYFSWSYFYQRREWAASSSRVVFIILAATTGWLLYMADSATSQGSLGMAVFLLIVSRMPFIAVKPKRLLLLTFFMALAFVGLQLVADISSSVISGLGRDPSLTTRVPMWEQLLSAPINIALGAGYESFWVTTFGVTMYERWGVFQAHNGYLELYLNLGLIGLGLFIAGTLVGLHNVRACFAFDHAFAVLRLCFILVVVVYNWTEATFYGPSNTWLLFLLGTVDAPGTLAIATQSFKMRHGSMPSTQAIRFDAGAVPDAVPLRSRVRSSSTHGPVTTRRALRAPSARIKS